jgi:hypothetical protein
MRKLTLRQGVLTREIFSKAKVRKGQLVKMDDGKLFRVIGLGEAVTDSNAGGTQLWDKTGVRIV